MTPLRLRVLVLAAAVAMTNADAAAQVLLHSGVGSSAGRGAGARTIVRVNDHYVAFFYDGARIVYRDSADGVTFSAARTVVTEQLGDGPFAVARSATVVGLLWRYESGATNIIKYAEAPASLPLTFGAAEMVDSASEPRGVMPALAFTASGVPFIASGGSGVPFTDFGGCGGTSRFRMVTYVRKGGAWSGASFCSLWNTPYAIGIALAPVGTSMVSVEMLDTYLGSSTFDGDAASANVGTALSERWKVISEGPTTEPVTVSAAGSRTTSTGIHEVHNTAGGDVVYARHDTGGSGSSGGTAVDRTMIAAGASYPTITRPLVVTAPYTILYVSGKSIQSRRFVGTVASLTPPDELVQATDPPTHLSSEAEADSAVAATWQVGNEIWFGVVAAQASSGAEPGPDAATSTPDGGPSGDAAASSARDGPSVGAEPGTGGGGGAGGAPGVDGGGAAGDPSSPGPVLLDVGCACRTASATSRGAAPVVATGLLLLALRLRSGRRRRSAH